MFIETEIKGINLKFETSDKVFSPKAIDRGTLAMLDTVDFKPGDRVLDLGCGYGVVGILAARLIGPENVVMVDIEENAVELAKRNAELNGVSGVEIFRSDGLGSVNENGFTLILSNPPYHADFSVPREFIEKGFNRLAIGGRLHMVTKRKDWYRNKLVSIFGGVKITESDDYFVFMSEKKDYRYAKRK